MRRAQNSGHQRPCPERPALDSRTSLRGRGQLRNSQWGAAPWPGTGIQRPAEKMLGFSSPEADRVPGRVWTAARLQGELSPRRAVASVTQGRHPLYQALQSSQNVVPWAGGGLRETHHPLIPGPLKHSLGECAHSQGSPCSSQPALTVRAFFLRPVSGLHSWNNHLVCLLF